MFSCFRSHKIIFLEHYIFPFLEHYIFFTFYRMLACHYPTTTKNLTAIIKQIYKPWSAPSIQPGRKAPFTHQNGKHRIASMQIIKRGSSARTSRTEQRTSRVCWGVNKSGCFCVTNCPTIVCGLCGSNCCRRGVCAKLVARYVKVRWSASP